jgi:protocatechuate 3,4-dioxygenase alpha subunit
MSLIVTPSQTVGPFLHIGLKPLENIDLAKDATSGERITVTGTVYDGDGKPIPDAMLDIWQANAAGKYNHPEDKQDKKFDPGFKGFGRCCTDADGKFRFLTIKPGQVPGPGNTLQAPHIVVAVFMRGMLKHAYTRIYFGDEKTANDADPILARIEEPGRKETLMSQRSGNEYRWDIHMQGDKETVFFDA